MMIFAWAFCAPVGMMIARSFKFMFPKRKICDLKVWFVIHRPLMILCTIVTIAAFIVILAQSNWKWIDPHERLEFVHSIFGIVAIGLSVIQVFVAFLR